MSWNPRNFLSNGVGMKLGMLACCAVMLVPLGGFLLAGGTLGGLASNLGLLAPLALCLGAHVVMHRMMGRSCQTAQRTPARRTPKRIGSHRRSSKSMPHADKAATGFGPRPKLVLVALLALAGCGTASRQCAKSDATISARDPAVALPAGCRAIEGGGGASLMLACEGGRVGFAF